MEHATSCLRRGAEMPDWVSDEVRLYLDHVEGGQSIRALARRAGLHASTVLRRVRKTETRRDDPLVDRALLRLGGLVRRQRGKRGDNAQEMLPEMKDLPQDEKTLHRDAMRILRALMREGAVLAVVPEVETAVVVVESADGRPRQVATVARRAAEAMALLGWIEKAGEGRVVRYRISPAGRRKLRALLAEAESANAAVMGDDRVVTHADGTPRSADLHTLRAARGRRRATGADSPLQVLARRRDKSGAPYLSRELLRVAERLRTDYELARLEGLPGSDWQAIVAAGESAGADAGGQARFEADSRIGAARARLRAALRFLGPELGDMALMTCCLQQGMEQTERQLHMPARAGKYVLRIALNMLLRHYRKAAGEDSDLIY